MFRVGLDQLVEICLELVSISWSSEICLESRSAGRSEICLELVSISWSE